MYNYSRSTRFARCAPEKAQFQAIFGNFFFTVDDSDWWADISQNTLRKTKSAEHLGMAPTIIVNRYDFIHFYVNFGASVCICRKLFRANTDSMAHPTQIRKEEFQIKYSQIIPKKSLSRQENLDSESIFIYDFSSSSQKLFLTKNHDISVPFPRRVVMERKIKRKISCQVIKVKFYSRRSSSYDWLIDDSPFSESSKDFLNPPPSSDFYGMTKSPSRAEVLPVNVLPVIGKAKMVEASKNVFLKVRNY